MTISSRSTWVALRTAFPSLALALAFVAVGIGLFVHGQRLMKEEIQTRLKATAAVAAGQFDPTLLDRIRGSQDLDSQILRSTVDRLGRIRDSVPNARYVYLMRATEDANTLSFIADSDTLQPLPILDANGDGKLQPDEMPSLPGEPYDVSAMPALRDAAFRGPSADADITTDQWGSFFSGYAPVRRMDGSVAAVVGIDIELHEYQQLISRAFSPLSFALFVAMGLVVSACFAVLLERNRVVSDRRIQDIRTGILQLAFHQLGSPLTTFKWSLELLKERQARSPDPEVAEHIRVMDDGIAFMKHLVDDLESADRVRAGHLDYVSKPGDLSRVIRAVAAEFSTRAAHNHQTIRLDILPNIVLSFDSALIAVVLRELIDNALVYSAPGSTITITLRRQGRDVEVLVNDQGIGIPKSEFDRVFAEFGRASNALTVHPSGSGLALFVAKGIVERAGGKMVLQSDEGKGSTFSFTLPRK